MRHTLIAMISLVTVLAGCTGDRRRSAGDLSMVDAQEFRVGEVCDVRFGRGVPTRRMRVVNPDEQAAGSRGDRGASGSDEIAIQVEDPSVNWGTEMYLEARNGIATWTPIDFDGDGVDELVVSRTLGYGNAYTTVVTVFRRRGALLKPTLEIRSPNPSSVTWNGDDANPPYGYVRRDIWFGRAGSGRILLVIETSADVPEGATVLDASELAELERGITVYGLDPDGDGFEIVGE